MWFKPNGEQATRTVEQFVAQYPNARWLDVASNGHNLWTSGNGEGIDDEYVWFDQDGDEVNEEY